LSIGRPQPEQQEGVMMMRMARTPALFGPLVLMLALLPPAGPARALDSGVSPLDAVSRQLAVGSGVVAKELCSGVLVSGRSPEAVWAEELKLERPGLLWWLGLTTRWEANTVSVGPFWQRRTAVFRPGLGCTLLGLEGTGALPPAAAALAPLSVPAAPAAPASTPASLPAALDPAQLKAALDWAFDSRPEWHTRAVVVLYDGQLVGERYAPGFGPNTPQTGWSMTKSVTNTLVGLALADRLIEGVSAKGLRPEWCREAGDPRCAITLDQLMRMTSGLGWLENYGETAEDDALPLLYLSGDVAAYAAAKPLQYGPPGRVYCYSTGTTDLIAGYLKQQLGARGIDLSDYARRRLFAPLGLLSATLETDAVGTPEGGSYLYASARDWAKLGLLYYWDGVWRGVGWDGGPSPAAPVRLLPEGWVKYSTTPTEAESVDPDSVAADYGAQLWLRIYPKLKDPSGKVEPPVPGDAFFFFGHDGQSTSIVPSKKLVVVRLGLTRGSVPWNQERFLSNFIAAVR